MLASENSFDNQHLVLFFLKQKCQTFWRKGGKNVSFFSFGLCAVFRFNNLRS